MEKFIILIFVCSLGALGSSRSTAKNMLWFPKDGDIGFVPGFLDSQSRGLVAPTANPNNIHFYLFTLNNKNNFDEIFNTTQSLDNSHWDVNAPVKIFSHGFASSYVGGSGEDMKQGYIDNGYPTNINLVMVEWKLLAAAPFYDIAAKNTKLVGEKIAYLIDFLIANEYTKLEQIHVGGHSLGAHVSGFAGHIFKDLNPGSVIPRVTGLDPALPLFGAVGDSERIDPTDATFVDIIHTASGTIAEGELSFIEPRGTVDFYPNKGRNQPGCKGLPDLFGACSHSRCYKYFAESIQSDNFVACRCNDDAWDPEGDDNFTSCSCNEKGSVNMGEWTPSSTHGIFYLTTNSKSPFAVGKGQ